MPVNPATKPEHLKSPIIRGNDVNDPSFENQQGYFPYDLTHAEFCTPLFGEVTPTMHLDTAPADRIVVKQNIKTLLNQINGNFLSEVNQYQDSFYVPLRCVYPNNYEKLIPNPTKGSDLPNSALPVVPLWALFYDYLFGTVIIRDKEENEATLDQIAASFGNLQASYNTADFRSYYLGRLLLLSTVLSRGQLMDYLGINLDFNVDDNGKSVLQKLIDDLFDAVYSQASEIGVGRAYNLVLTEDTTGSVDYLHNWDISTPSLFRSYLSDVFEAGKLPYLDMSLNEVVEAISGPFDVLIEYLHELFGSYIFSDTSVSDIDTASNPFADGGYINIGKFLAYQQSIAQYYTNDSVDNIFNADLYMQLLRAVMFPTDDNFTREPIFMYNGVQTEYDLITTGAFYASFAGELEASAGSNNRQYVFLTMLFLKRRSLRYGDYFSTARPRMLAVGELTIPVGEGVAVVDVTKNLLMQRYLNAVNYVGSGFLQYMSSQFGVKPSDTGTYPRFLGHRKVVLQSQITNNTADNQGAQTTNLVASVGDQYAFDVFIDDFGFIISQVSYDVMPVYKSGIDPCYYFADRFDFFNPMLQNIGDQPIRLNSLLGRPQLYDNTFGYTMRNAEYKYKLAKAHGAFVNDLPGFLLSYPLNGYLNLRDLETGEFIPDIHISPDFIRDKPLILDSIVPQMTGISPARYFHFVLAVLNDVQCARKIQSTPPILF